MRLLGPVRMRRLARSGFADNARLELLGTEVVGLAVVVVPVGRLTGYGATQPTTSPVTWLAFHPMPSLIPSARPVCLHIPSSTSVTASGDLSSGMGSCSASVDVTADTIGTYASSNSNIASMGLGLPIAAASAGLAAPCAVEGVARDPRRPPSVLSR
jgi:hypothetical protein